MSMTNTLFRLTFPDGWRETTTFTFEGPHDSGVQHNLVVSALPGLARGTPVQSLARDQLDISTQALPGFEMLNEGLKTGDDGQERYEAVYRYVPSDELTLYQKQYFIIRERTGFIFTSTFSRKTLQTVAPAVDAIVDSLESQL